MFGNVPKIFNFEDDEYHAQPTWISKLDETTVVTVDIGVTTWKIWTTITKSFPINTITQSNYDFKFTIKQVFGPRKCAQFCFQTGNIKDPDKLQHFICYSSPEQFSITSKQDNDNQFVISAMIRLNQLDPTFDATITRKPGDYVLSIGDKKIGVYSWVWPVSEKLEKLVDNSEARLYGVDYEDFRTLINQDSIDADITVDKCRSFAEIERRYGIKCYSEKVRKMLETDFWYNTDKVNDKIMVHEEKATITARPDMKISKTYRAPSLPNKYTINAFNMNFDTYMYIQEYNNKSYVSFGVITDKSTDNEHWSSMISLNIKLHHPQNPALNQSADISREFNNYQRSAGCPTFMLNSELGDYCQRDGSYIITISLSPTVITNDIQYPGIKDVMVCKGNKEIMVSKDLLLHYCGYFITSSNTDKLSTAMFNIQSLKILLDLIYHRSTALTFTNIQKLLNLSEMIMCPYAYNHCDKLLANHYHSKFLSINRTKEFMDGWDLPQLTEAEKMSKYDKKEIRGRSSVTSFAIFHDALPVDAREVNSYQMDDLLAIILPLEGFEDEKEKDRIIEKFQTSYGERRLDEYKRMIFTLEGVPKRLKTDLRRLIRSSRWDIERLYGVLRRLSRYGACVANCQRLSKEAKEQKELVDGAVAELNQMLHQGNKEVETLMIDKILGRSEKDAERGRRMAAKMFYRWIRKEAMKRYEDRGSGGDSLQRLRDWVEYLDI